MKLRVAEGWPYDYPLGAESMGIDLDQVEAVWTAGGIIIGSGRSLMIRSNRSQSKLSDSVSILNVIDCYMTSEKQKLAGQPRRAAQAIVALRAGPPQARLLDRMCGKDILK